MCDYIPHLVSLTDEQQRDALSHQQALEQSLEQLMASSRLRDANPPDTFAAIQRNLHGLKDFLSQISQTAIYNEIRPAHSTTALGVFQVPELLELILAELSLHELLRMRQVSRYMKLTIEKSSRLQVKLFLRPAAPGSHFAAPCLWDLAFIAPGFACEAIHVAEAGIKRPNDVNVKAAFQLRSKQTLPPITPTGRKMLVCQPPICEMEVKVECCAQAWTVEGPEEQPEQVLLVGLPTMQRLPLACKLENPQGLTIGELYDCAKEVIEKHRYCPHAAYRTLDEYGLVDAGLHFRGKVSVQTDDPVLRALAIKEQEAARSAKSRRWGQRRVKREYAHAKRTGEQLTTRSLKANIN